MPAIASRDATDPHAETKSLEPILHEIAALLETKRFGISEEIRNYPAPIPACDQHFNYMLEERARISDELNRVVKLITTKPAHKDDTESIDEFVRFSRDLDDDAKRKIRSRLQCDYLLSSTPGCSISGRSGA
jgi:hypothetical protein